MIWNTIVHPKMMDDDNPGGGEPLPSSDDTTESVVEGIKYADPHKLAFLDLLVDATDEHYPKLIHGDFEIVKNKILNHEFVIGAMIQYLHREDPNKKPIRIAIGGTLFTVIRWLMSENGEFISMSCDISIMGKSQTITFILHPDNTIGLEQSAS